jgi:hypothetical protein
VARAIFADGGATPPHAAAAAAYAHHHHNQSQYHQYQQHPQHYAAVHAWHARERADQPVDTGPHDTRVWIRLARDIAAFGSAGSVFERVHALWQAGLVAGF